MKTTKKIKRFDALEFKTKTQSEIANEILGMNSSQEIEYFRKGVEKGALSVWWQQVQLRQSFKPSNLPQRRRKRFKGEGENVA